MDKEKVITIRDSVFKHITYYNKTFKCRMNPPMAVRLDNDVIVDLTKDSAIWDDENGICYYFSTNSKYSTFEEIGRSFVKFPAMLSSFDYEEIQEIFLTLNAEAFGQAVAVINKMVPNGRPAFLTQNEPITESQFRDIWQRYIDAANANKSNVQYKIDAKVIFDLNGATGSIDPVYAHYTKERVTLPVPGDDITPPDGKKFKFWNTQKDGSGVVYYAGVELIPTSKELTLYAIWGD